MSDSSVDFQKYFGNLEYLAGIRFGEDGCGDFESVKRLLKILESNKGKCSIFVGLDMHPNKPRTPPEVRVYDADGHQGEEIEDHDIIASVFFKFLIDPNGRKYDEAFCLGVLHGIMSSSGSFYCDE